MREAGGYVTDIDGVDAMLSKGHIVAGNEAIHGELLRLLKTAATRESDDLDQDEAASRSGGKYIEMNALPLRVSVFLRHSSGMNAA